MTRLLQLALLVAPAVAAAQTCPVADGDLGSAVGAGVAAGDTCGAGSDQGASCGARAASEELVYTWTAPSDGRFSVSAAGSAYDTVVYVVDATTCGEEVCNDDSVGLQSVVTFDALIGETFLIAIDGYDTSSCGAFTLAIETCSGDADGDGICDESDLCEGLDFYGDYDSDGICDDLDPCPDSDGDYVCDVYDQCQGYDWAGDFDSDGICDDLDPCAPDTDGDTVCDAYDWCVGDDFSGDFDYDGTCDDLDPCAPDSDGDGTCDTYDFCIGDDASGDSDFDGICDDGDFVLVVEKGLATDPTVLTVHNAPPGAIVTFVTGRHFGPWCPGAANPVCYDVGAQSGTILTLTRADANGDATFSFVNPAFAVDNLVFQASWAMMGVGDVTNRVYNGSVAPAWGVLPGVYTNRQEVVASTCGTFVQDGPSFPVYVDWASDTDLVIRAPRSAHAGPVRCAVDPAGVATCADNGQWVRLMPQAEFGISNTNAMTILDDEHFSILSDSTIDCRGTRCPQFGALFGTTFPCEVTVELAYDFRF